MQPPNHQKKRFISPAQLSLLLQQEKIFLQGVGDTCFDRCIIPYGEKAYNIEFLNPAEQNCVDRCTSKAYQVLKVMEGVKNGGGGKSGFWNEWVVKPSLKTKFEKK